MTRVRPTFYHIDQQAGWRTIAASGLRLDGDIRLHPLPDKSRPLADESGRFGGLSLPSALAVDDQGRIYVLAGEQIFRYDPCDPAFKMLAGIGGSGGQPRAFNRPRGLAICGDDLYVADSGNRRVQVFALKGLPLRYVWGPLRVIKADDAYHVRPAKATCPEPCPEGQPDKRPFPEGTWLPWDVAPGPGGRTYVSDAANSLIHLFDAQGRWRAAFDGADDDGQTLVKPTALALDNEDYLYIVQDGRPDVVVLDQDGQFLRRVESSLEPGAAFSPAAVGFDDQGRLFLSDGVSGHLFVYDESGDTAGNSATLIHCQAFKGFGCAITFDLSGRPVLADRLSGMLYELEAEGAFAKEGQVLIGPLDSEIYRCQWHRVVLEGLLEEGTYVEVATLSSDASKLAAQVLNLPENRWATNQRWTRASEGPWDCLVRSQPGRYLWLRLTLHGSGRATPIIRSIRAHYPRAASSRFLPAVFREEPESADFLDRFLSITDSIYQGTGRQVSQMDRLFDPMSTPAGSNPGQADFLSWLAGWLGLALEQSWPEEKRRRLVRLAHRLYALRGTVQGLKEHVALYTGVEPGIVEHFKLRRWLFLNRGRLGDDTVLWGQEIVDRLQLGQHDRIGDFRLWDSGDPVRDPFHVHAHQFTLYVPLKAGSDRQERAIGRIVELAKPAHTKGTVELVASRLQVGRQSIVGVNTIIGCYPSGLVTGEGSLGYDTVLSPSEEEETPPTMQVGKRARIGSSTLID